MSARLTGIGAKTRCQMNDDMVPSGGGIKRVEAE
jgi:hypothetical protein